MKIVNVCVWILTIASLTTAHKSAEPYLYVVYYENEGCGGGAVSMIGFASEDDEILYGGRSSTGLCAHESICLVDWDSSQCQEMERTKAGNMTFSIGEEGLIFQCDETDTDGDCSVLDKCYGSSVYPNCHFIVALTSEIVANPDLIRNTDTSNLDQQSYLMFYSDAECSDFEGMQSVASGPTDLAVTDVSVSCQDAMACLFFPDGQACEKAVNGGELGTTRIIAETRNNGRNAFSCEEDGTCSEMSPDVCMSSSIHPSCHYRWVSAVQLIEDPAKFLNSPSAPEPTTAPTPAPTPSSSTLSKLSVLIFLVAGATVGGAL